MFSEIFVYFRGMKLILSLLVLSFSVANSQKIALLNTNFKSPIIYTDSVTAEQVSNLFPVPVDEFDTLCANLEYLNQMLQVRQRSKLQSFELHSGNVIISVSRVPFSYGDRYLIKAVSFGDVTSSLNLSDINKTNKKNSENLERLIAYIKSNKSLFKSPYEVHPKIYNAVVITE